jgi:pimeloyl-ACP methyl ester carboxylesterase
MRLLLPLALIAAASLQAQTSAAEPKIDTGEINGSHFRIDIPANYNGSLVLYCHGYGGNVKYDQKPPGAALKIFADAGYAVAQAGYAGGGWAVKEAIQDTEALRRYFAAKYGKPKHVWVTGHSMGGIITLAIIEKFPESYDGALPICGPLGPSLDFMQRRMFDLLVVFDYYYPGAIGSPVKIADKVEKSAAYAMELNRIINQDPVKKAALLKYTGFATEAELPIGVGFFANIQKELLTRAGGNPFDNRDTIYWGGVDDPAINRGVKRYAADPQAAEYLRTYYTPTARLARPVLALHTVYDPIVPAWAPDYYAEMIRHNGMTSMYVQRYSTRGGHCAVNAEQTLHAFDDLRAWVETGKRPEPGEQK